MRKNVFACTDKDAFGCAAFLGGCALVLLVSGCCRALGSGSHWSCSWEWYCSLFLDSHISQIVLGQIAGISI